MFYAIISILCLHHIDLFLNHVHINTMGVRRDSSYLAITSFLQYPSNVAAALMQLNRPHEAQQTYRAIVLHFRKAYKSNKCVSINHCRTSLLLEARINQGKMYAFRAYPPSCAETPHIQHWWYHTWPECLPRIRTCTSGAYSRTRSWWQRKLRNSTSPFKGS